MLYKNKLLRRLWEVTVYTGNPDVKKPKTKKETVLAWNMVDAVRRTGGQVAKQPVSLGYVTWPETEDGPIYFIESTAGPSSKKVKPTIEPAPGEWDF
jgi:hypothetical protein